MTTATISPALDGKERIFVLLTENRDKITAFGVKRIGLFGSFVRGEQRQDSDVDFLVKFETGKKTFDNFMQLSFFLEDLLNRPVQILTPEYLSPHIGPHILAEVEYVAFDA
jgi:uncharacterized protein